MKKELIKLKEEVFNANIALFNSGLVPFTFGNVSGLDESGKIMGIKPSGVEYAKMKLEDIVLLDLDGNIIESTLNPSSDTKTHIELYKHFKGIRGIVHTHSEYATSWSQSKKAIPCLGTTHADYFYGDIPCTNVISDIEIDSDYEKETGQLIIATFEKKKINHMDVRACLVACHGPFTWGSSPAEAVEVSMILEIIAKTSYISLNIDSSIKSIKQTLLDKHYLRKHGKQAYYGQKTIKI